MRKIIMVAVLGLATFGCRNVSNGVCNICSSAKSVDTSQCGAQGVTYHCASAKIVEKTDNSCGSNDGGTYQACEFKDCDIGFDCKKIATYGP